MIVCPTCAEDCDDIATTCTACGSALPEWLTHMPLSTPPPRSSILGWALVIVCGVLLFVEASGAMGWLAYLDTIHRR